MDENVGTVLTGKHDTAVGPPVFSSAVARGATRSDGAATGADR
ncbi:hypothetical protein OG203_26620 [Nocardia sp. NBC_01499]